MHRWRQISCFFFAALTVVVLLGCDQGEPLGQITGRVTFQGQPVTEGLVIFIPNDPRKGVYMTGQIKQDGTYVVTSATRPGIPLGQYTVTVSPPMQAPVMGPMQQALPPKPYPNIPPRYRNPKTSELSLDVKDGENSLNVDMRP